ncbi:MAG: methylenetetrahydrofolate reductase C-terminal domain-containing protein [Pseudomonadota bacterium]
MYRVRQWSVSHSRLLESFYRAFESFLVKLHPIFDRVGYQRLEKPVRVMEKAVKSVMFDCQMCGKCALSSTGMSCPMNCPKSIRNGPCGGVRLNGHCEVKPEMRCVWVEAWRGSQQMKDSEAIRQVQLPVNQLFKGSSSWLRVVRDKAAAQSEASQ